MTHYLDPVLLGVVPPMDLGLGDAEHISPFPLKLRVHDNARPTVGGVGLFGSRRDGDEPDDLIRLHAGVDLLAPVATQVFSVQRGTVRFVAAIDLPLGGVNTTVLIEHTSGFRYFSFYSELMDVSVREGDQVRQGQPIGRVRDFERRDDHLHFEIRYPFENSDGSLRNCLPVDPTWALYDWERKRYRNNDATRRVVPAGQMSVLNEIVRGRLLRFLRVEVQDFDGYIYYPLGHLEDEGRSLIETLRSAFGHRHRVELVCRDSLFFNQIEFLFNEDDKILVLAEVRVIAP